MSLWKDHLGLLAPIARFITPQIPKMSRFDCIFYAALAGVVRVNLGHNGPLEQLSIHVEESNKYFWATPQEYLQMMKEGKVFLPPPQNIILNYIAVNGAEYTRQKIEVKPFLGQFASEGVFVLPGDKDYDYEIFEQL